MSINKSFVLLSAFPSSKDSDHALQRAIEFIKPYDFSMVEYYCENSRADNVRNLLGGYRSIFLGAALQKAQGLNLCTSVAGDRRKSVKALAECFRFAREAGAESVLINSGTRPEHEEQDAICLEYLKDSIFELHHSVNDIHILLEPGDRDIQYRHLIGHTDMAVAFIEDIRRDVPCISLVFDISHIAQLNENLSLSWERAKKYCSHVHLANCVLDKASPLFGDKHPLFSEVNGIYSHDAAKAFYRYLLEESEPPSVGIEMICSEESEQNFFERFAAETDWFFQSI